MRLAPTDAARLVALAILAAGSAAAAEPEGETAATGARFGAILVKPAATLETVYDDNIFRRERNRKGSPILRAGAALSAETDWRRHKLAVEARAMAGFYARSSADDYLDGGVDVTGELDATRAVRARLVLGLARGHEARGGVDAPETLAGPARYWRARAELAGQYAPGRLRAQPFVGFERLDYENQRLQAGGVANQNDRDRSVLRAGLKALYAAPGAATWFVEGEIRRIDYDDPRDRNGLNRDATGLRLFAGVRLDPRAPLAGAVAVGWQRRRFDDPSLRAVSGPALEARLDWRPSRILELKLRARRDLDETTLASASVARATALEARASWEVRRFVELIGEAGFERRAFRGIGRRDDRLALGLGVQWRLRRDATISAGARRVEERSNAPGEDSRANILWIAGEYRF